LNNGNHLNDIENLYSTELSNNCIISAEIECSKKEIISCVVNKAMEEKTELYENFISKIANIESIIVSRLLSENEKVYFFRFLMSLQMKKTICFVKQ